MNKLKTIDQSKLNVKSIKSKKNKVIENQKEESKINAEESKEDNKKDGVKIKIPRKVKK